MTNRTATATATADTTARVVRVRSRRTGRRGFAVMRGTDRVKVHRFECDATAHADNLNARRSAEDRATDRLAVLAAVEAGATSAREIAAATGLPLATVRRDADALARSGRITRTVRKFYVTESLRGAEFGGVATLRRRVAVYAAG